MTRPSLSSQASNRIPCQVCLRPLVPRKDGTSRNHVSHRGAEDYCQGSGHRLARWEVGQRLRHHAGSVWEVIEVRNDAYQDYLLVCLVGTRSYSDPDRWLEEPGKTMVTHGEYMHRHGWTPLAPDLMRALAKSLQAVTSNQNRQEDR